MNEFTDFLQKELAATLGKLHPDTRPLWGILTPQHMLEHVVGSWRVSNGNAEAKLVISQEDLDKNREFLFSDREFARNTQNPIMPKGGLWPLRKPGLEEAKTQLLKEVADFFTYYDTHPDARHMHPIFGLLNREEWLIFQRKHMQHHFRQFGMIGEEETL